MYVHIIIIFKVNTHNYCFYLDKPILSDAGPSFANAITSTKTYCAFQLTLRWEAKNAVGEE